MEAIKAYTENLDLDFVRESLGDVYNALKGRISGRNVVIPVSGMVVFYLLFVRQVDGKKKKKRLMKKPCRPDEEYTGDEHPSIELNLPVVDNWLVIAILRKLYRTVFGKYLLSRAKRKPLMDLPCGELPEEPTFYPLVTPSEDLLKRKQITEKELWQLVESRREDSFNFNSISDYVKLYRREDSFNFNSIPDYVKLYRNGEITPLDVAKKTLQAFKEDDDKLKHKLKAIIAYNEDDVIKQAKESTERWRSGTMLSIFDGVPVAIKDEYIVGGYAARNGLPVSHNDHIYDMSDEGGLVKRLRNGGAIIIGIANMHQIGIGVFGINPSKHHGTSRNPYNTDYVTAGSSGGSAAAISAGFCPVALGTDGGCSIRVPAVACGVVGLKATYGRFSRSGMVCNSVSVGHTGPLCSSVRDTAISYGFLAGKDLDDEKSLLQSPVYLGDFENTDLSGMRIGFDPAFLERCNPEIQSGLLKAMDWLKTKHNVTMVQVHFPEFEETARALGKILFSEMAHVNEDNYCNHYDELNIGVIFGLTFGRSVSSSEYLICTRQRTRCMNAMKYIFTQVDAMITPLSQEYVPLITPSRKKYGYANTTLAVKLSQFSSIGNLSGVPAIAVPVDYSPTNQLPIGVQVMAPWWREDVLLRVAYAIESNVELKKPQVFYDVLKE